MAAYIFDGKSRQKNINLIITIFETNTINIKKKVKFH